MDNKTRGYHGLPFSKIFPILIILFAFLYSCHSLPPYEPFAPEQIPFVPAELSWEEASMPPDLLGSWYMGDNFYLSVREGVFQEHDLSYSIRSFTKSDSYYFSYYRIIYYSGISGRHSSIYFRSLTDDEVQIIHAEGSAGDEQGALALPVVSSWIRLTSINAWVPTNMPEFMPGNWHIKDGEMEVSISQQAVVLDGQSWQIDSIKTNRTVNWLILKSGESYKSLYCMILGDYSMKALLAGGREDIQGSYGQVPGDWNTLYRWWNFTEKALMSPGSSWNYEYTYQRYYDQVYDTSTPVDNIVQTDTLKGRLELQVTVNTISGEGGSIVLQASFQTDEEKGHYYHSQRSDSLRVLTDSSWTGPGGVITEQYEIILENDTLWYQTEQGNIFFASMKLQPGSQVNLLAFVKPFEFSTEGFPTGDWSTVGPLTLPHEEVPRYYTWTNDNSRPLAGLYPAYGLCIQNYACLDFEFGIQSVKCLFVCSDLRAWDYGDYSNPYTKKTSFECELISFTPGS